MFLSIHAPGRFYHKPYSALLPYAAGCVLFALGQNADGAQTSGSPAPAPGKAGAAQAAPLAPGTPGSPAPVSSARPAPSVPLLAAPDVRIETFAVERGYVVGVDNVVLLCVARNLGQTTLPAEALRLRCYPISGLDYTSGNLIPTLPSLAPGQAVAYRWRLAASDAKNALVAGVALEAVGDRKKERTDSTGMPPPTPHSNAATPPAGSAVLPIPADTPGQNAAETGNVVAAFAPQIAFAVTPRLARTPGVGDLPLLKDPLPHAGERDGLGLLLNNHVGVRVQVSERREPFLLLAAREGASWRAVASSLPLLRACASEDGQQPWWQSFRCQQMRAREDRDSATLTLTGNIGAACRAEIAFETRPDTGMISGRARLTALRPLRLSSVQLPDLLAGSDDKSLSLPRADGSPTLLADTPSLLPDDSRIAAGHAGAATFGITWPADPPLPAWKWNRLPPADGVYTLNYGVQASGDPHGDLVPAGATVEFAFRLFAFAPSDTVRDAMRFQYP